MNFEYVTNALSIFDPALKLLQLKTVRTKLNQVDMDVVQIPMYLISLISL